MAPPSLHHHNTDTVQEVQLQLFSRGLLHLGPDNSTPIPTGITAAPTPIKYDDYLAVKELQPAINTCLDNMSRDTDFIVSSLSKVAEHDPFCQGFLDIYKDLPDPARGDISLGLFRHDFMYAAAEPRSDTAHLDGQFKLVEFNLVAASMGALTEGVSRYHTTVLNRAGLGNEQVAGEMNIVGGYSEGIARAHGLYQTQHGSTNCVVVLVETAFEGNFNYFDQQIPLNAVEEEGVSTVRCSTDYLLKHGRVSEHGRYLIQLGGDESVFREVSVFYLRTMYAPSHFPGPEYWSLRRDMEMSRAVCTPSIPHTIVNMKLFQMLLTQVGSNYRSSAPSQSYYLMFSTTLLVILM